MAPLLVLALAAGGLFAVSKIAKVTSKSAPAVKSCQTNKLAPVPADGVVFSNGQVDYTAFGNHMRGIQTQMKGRIENTAATVGVAVSTFFPVAAPYAAAAVLAIDAATEAYYAWFASKSDSAEWEAEFKNQLKRWVDRGFIPPLMSDSDTFKAAAENLRDALWHIDALEPYAKWTFDASGYMLARWGGHPQMAFFLTQFLGKSIASAQGMAGLGTAATFGSVPNGGDSDLTHNQARLKLVSMAIALEYGVQDRAKEVYDYALAQASQWESYLKWKTNWGEGSGTTADEVVRIYTPIYHYAVGVWAAFTKATALACKAGPPSIADGANAGKVPSNDSPFIQQASVGV